ncbi:hypothetical protein [Pseudomonas sp. CGJS7]|uniref:hypothetical protein n=1 Tax=Pseudomonas sp. CGJS7 TaxID=3109348 RepID=UPI0030096787
MRSLLFVADSFVVGSLLLAFCCWLFSFGPLLSASLFAFARHSREGGNPVPFVRERLKSLDSRFRGNDGLER